MEPCYEWLLNIQILQEGTFEARGVHAECIKLNGAMELAPSLGLCRRIVDLVESGNTLIANGSC